MQKVTADMTIAEVLRLDKVTVSIFLNNGLHCLGWPNATAESIEEACEVHGLDVNKLLRELNDYLENKKD